mmetsp:Transcript_41275/g.90043  ORF Transcript_41275/g.90043 Transcript_41275/m.90043 type:complete len:352 (+) Transcript_41275:260-1315(+)
MAPQATYWRRKIPCRHKLRLLLQQPPCSLAQMPTNRQVRLPRTLLGPSPKRALAHRRPRIPPRRLLSPLRRPATPPQRSTTPPSRGTPPPRNPTPKRPRPQQHSQDLHPVPHRSAALPAPLFQLRRPLLAELKMCRPPARLDLPCPRAQHPEGPADLRPWPRRVRCKPTLPRLGSLSQFSPTRRAMMRVLSTPTECWRLRWTLLGPVSLPRLSRLLPRAARRWPRAAKLRRTRRGRLWCHRRRTSPRWRITWLTAWCQQRSQPRSGRWSQPVLALLLPPSCSWCWLWELSVWLAALWCRFCGRSLPRRALSRRRSPTAFGMLAEDQSDGLTANPGCSVPAFVVGLLGSTFF